MKTGGTQTYLQVGRVEGLRSRIEERKESTNSALVVRIEGRSIEERWYLVTELGQKLGKTSTSKLELASSCASP